MRGPGIKPNTSTGEPAEQIDIAPTVLELAGADSRQEHRRPVDGPLLPRPEPAHQAAAPLRVVRRNQRRRLPGRGRPDRRPGHLRRPAGGEPRQRADPGAGRRQRLDPGAARRTTRESASGPTSCIAWPDGEKELYDINKDPYELNNIAKDPNFFPIRNYLYTTAHRRGRRRRRARGLRRPRVLGAGGENPADRKEL